MCVRVRSVPVSQSGLESHATLSTVPPLTAVDMATALMVKAIVYFIHRMHTLHVHCTCYMKHRHVTCIEYACTCMLGCHFLASFYRLIAGFGMGVADCEVGQ